MNMLLVNAMNTLCLAKGKAQVVKARANAIFRALLSHIGQKNKYLFIFIHVRTCNKSSLNTN